MTVGWFTNRTNDLIVTLPVASATSCVADPTAFNYEPCNIDHAFMQGFTLDVRTPRSRGFTTSLNITDLYRAQNLDTQTRLPNQAVITANLRLDYSGASSSVLDSWGVWMHMMGARGFVDPTQPLFYQPAAYSNLNAYLRLRAGRETMITLRGYNLGNERYASVSGYPMPGRSFTVELSSR